MEDEVYICGWKQDSTGFTLWVKSNPRMTGQGASLEEAEEALANSISDNWGAMHPVFEFVPPLPKSSFDAAFSQPDIELICGDTRVEVDEPRQMPFETPEEFEIRMQWYDQFFEEPCCRKCGNATAPRNNKPLTLTFVESGYDGGFLPFPRHGKIYFYSDDFLRLLTEAELSHLDFRKCIRTHRSRKQFFELIGPSGPRFVAVKEREAKGWYCEVCRFQTFGYWAPDSEIHDFVAQKDLNSPSEVFTVGTQPYVHLCASMKRWQSMVGCPGTKRICSERLGVVADQALQVTPQLITFEEFDRH